MKRKLYALLLAVCMVFITVLSFNSCFSEEPSGIVEARINDDGELIVVYQDGSEKSLGRVVGQDGADGKDGASGISETVATAILARTEVTVLTEKTEKTE